MVALLARNEIKFVDGRLPALDEDDENYDLWIQCNSLVISWIPNSVFPTITDSIMYMEDASCIWSELQERFHQKNDPRVFEVMSLCTTLSSKECGICCKNTGHNLARSQILLQDPLPNANKAYASIIQEEKQRGIVIPQTENNQSSNDNTEQFDGNTHANHENNYFDNKNDNHPVYSHCGIPGHTIDKCYIIHGYPLDINCMANFQENTQ
ncbi:hypothetical protein CsatB_001944 [Cannabis sativa]